MSRRAIVKHGKLRRAKVAKLRRAVERAFKCIEDAIVLRARGY